MEEERGIPSKSLFRRKDRIKKKTDIKKVLDNGIRKKCQCGLFVYRENNKQIDRFCVLIGKKNGNAVKRNRVKRRIKEIYRKKRELNNKKKDIIFRPKKNCLLKKKNEIEIEIVACLKMLQ